MSKTVYLYFHGGPGLSSHADQTILDPFLQAKNLQMHFWHEPSEQRDGAVPFQKEGAYKNYVRSAEKFIEQHTQEESQLVVVAHSFAALPLLHLVNKHQDKINRVVFIAPGFMLANNFVEVANLAIADLEQANSEISQKIAEKLKASQGNLNSEMLEALELSLQDPQLFGHYWTDQQIMMAWAAVLGEPGKGVDLVAWKSVLEDLIKNPVRPELPEPLKIPVEILLGSEDKIVSRQGLEEISQNCFTNCQFQPIFGRGHYPHLEDPQGFIQILEA